MEKKLEGRTVLITGASGGIGKATSLLFAKEGANLCLVDVREEELIKVTTKCKSFEIKVLNIPVDITDKMQVERMAKETFATFNKIDILINNAGYGKYAPFTETPIEEWDRMWMVNVRGNILITQAIVPQMIKAKSGHIVNVSSIHGIHTSANASAYCATKFAVTGLTEALSKELWKDGIKVSGIFPGGVLTSFLGIPPEQKSQDFLEPEEVAAILLDIVIAPNKALLQKVVIVPRNRPYILQEM